MKILALVIPLLLVVAVRAGDPDDSTISSNPDYSAYYTYSGDPAGPSYPDTCNYTERGRAMCGDQCYNRKEDYCYCGSDRIDPFLDDEHCCGESCTLNSDGDGRCRQGRKLSRHQVLSL